jgi:hypothetical protein
VRLQRQVRRLGPNSLGEELSPGAVADCSLGLLVDQPLAATLPTPGSLLMVGPAALLDERVRQPDGRAVYDVPTATPDCDSGSWVCRRPSGGATAVARHRLGPGSASTQGIATFMCWPCGSITHGGLWESCTISCILLRHIDCMVITN